jgi:hypothetical protein
LKENGEHKTEFCISGQLIFNKGAKNTLRGQSLIYEPRQEKLMFYMHGEECIKY